MSDARPFAHLHCHTTYSTLDGATRLKDLITKVKAILGPRANDDRHARVLNRTITWVLQTSTATECIEIEADNRHRDLVLRQLGLSKTSKGVKTPGVKVFWRD